MIKTKGRLTGAAGGKKKRKVNNLTNLIVSKSDSKNNISKTPKLAEPQRVHLCEVCGSDIQVKDVAIPDTGHLFLCAACRILFAFGPDQGGKNGR